MHVQVMQPRQRDTEAVVFTWRQSVKLRKYRQVLPGGVTQVIIHPSEESMLQGWLAWLQTADPDILNVFQASVRCSICFVSGHICIVSLKPEEHPVHQAGVHLHLKRNTSPQSISSNKDFSSLNESANSQSCIAACLLEVRGAL